MVIQTFMVRAKLRNTLLEEVGR
jgi:hypothetical protein